LHHCFWEEVVPRCVIRAGTGAETVDGIDEDGIHCKEAEIRRERTLPGLIHVCGVSEMGAVFVAVSVGPKPIRGPRWRFSISPGIAFTNDFEIARIRDVKMCN
jgi:hypothetical protein